MGTTKYEVNPRKRATGDDYLVAFHGTFTRIKNALGAAFKKRFFLVCGKVRVPTVTRDGHRNSLLVSTPSEEKHLDVHIRGSWRSKKQKNIASKYYYKPHIPKNPVLVVCRYFARHRCWSIDNATPVCTSISWQTTR